jgi:ABC-type amino acid transport substrate-binding protein
MDSSATNIHNNWDSSIVSIGEFVQIDNNFKQDYEDAIAAKLLVDLDNKSKYVLGTLFNSTAKNIKKLYDWLIDYKNQADVDTLTTDEQKHLALLNKKLNHLGFETPACTLRISDAMPDDEEYKFVYMAAFIALQPDPPIL